MWRRDHNVTRHLMLQIQYNLPIITVKGIDGPTVVTHTANIVKVNTDLKSKRPWVHNLKELLLEMVIDTSSTTIVGILKWPKASMLPYHSVAFCKCFSMEMTAGSLTLILHIQASAVVQFSCCIWALDK